MLARKSERTSSKGSYESDSGETSRSEVPAGRGGRMYAGPRVRVRRGRREMLPRGVFLSYFNKVIKKDCLGVSWVGGHGGRNTDYADVRILKKDGVVCLWGL